MKIGDRVRFLKGQEEGRIVSKSDHDIYDVEIEDGFVIPMESGELVVIASEEGDYFQKSDEEKIPDVPSKAFALAQGLYLVLHTTGAEMYVTSLLNLLEEEALLTLHIMRDGKIKPVLASVLMPGKKIEVGKFPLTDLGEGKFIFRCLLFHQSKDVIKPAIERNLKIKPNNLKKKVEIPGFEEKGFVMQIDSLQKEISSSEILEKWQTGSARAEFKDLHSGSGKNLKVDLHIEAFSHDYATMSNDEILNEQMAMFEKELDNAIINNAESIVFIHGVGNGILRKKIHQKLSKHNHIRFYEDAEKSKFGYGATKVTLK